MTDILDFTVSNFVANQAKYQQDIEHVFKLNQIIYTITSASTIQFLTPFSQLNSFNKFHPFYQYYLLSTVQYSERMFCIKSAIFDSNSNKIKASSLQQKTFLIKFAMILNKKNQIFQIKVHPMSGQIQLHYFFCLFQYCNIAEIVYQFLNNFQKNHAVIFQILQSLEQVPIENSENQLYNKILQKFESIRPLLINSNSPQQKKQSQQQNSHLQYFTSELRTPIKISQSGNMNVLQRMKKTYVDQHQSYFVKNSTKIKQYNLSYIVLDNTPALNELLKCIESSDNITHRYGSVQNFTTQGRKINIQYKSIKPEILNYQYLIADKISKKKNYLTFVKQYIISKNNLEICKFFLLTKKSEQLMQNLQRFRIKNKLTMSFETKLNIISQLVSIACICMQQIQNFQPNLNLSNIIMTKDMQLKLDSLYRPIQCPKICLIQSIHQLLFSTNCYFILRNELKVNSRVNIQNQQLKHNGPSIAIKLFIKFLQNYQKNKENSHSVINLLLSVHRLKEGYQSIFGTINE